MSDNPFVKDARLVQPRPGPNGQIGAVVLDRVEPGVTPEYCVHGKTTCYFCNEWLWLGDQTYELVSSGRAAGVCLPCATEKFPPAGMLPVRHLHDHRRADGPH